MTRYNPDKPMIAAAHARLDVPYPALKAWLLAAEIYVDRGHEDANGGLHLAFGNGFVHICDDAGGSALLLEAQDEQTLQSLRDTVTEGAAEAHLTPIWRETHKPGKPVNLCIVKLERIEQISPAFRRLWLKGPELQPLLAGGLHFRFLLGQPGVPLPTVDTRGVTQWPGGPAAWHRPIYTMRSVEAAGPDTRISVDIFLHQGGRVTAWSETLIPGQDIALMGPSGGDIPQTSGGAAPWFAFFGDETALSAIARIVAELPQDAVGKIVVQLPSIADQQVLTHPPGLHLRWLLRDTPTSLLDALQASTIPASNRFVFFSAESIETTAARSYLLAKGLAKQEFWAQAYWQNAGLKTERQRKTS